MTAPTHPSVGESETPLYMSARGVRIMKNRETPYVMPVFSLPINRIRAHRRRNLDIGEMQAPGGFKSRARNQANKARRASAGLSLFP